MGRMPDFMNAMVTDVATMNLPRNPRFSANLMGYYEDCRDHDWCLTHTLVDPQVDRSKGPAEQADPRVALHLVREIDRGIIVNGARMLFERSRHLRTNCGSVPSTRANAARKHTRFALAFRSRPRA